MARGQRLKKSSADGTQTLLFDCIAVDTTGDALELERPEQHSPAAEAGVEIGVGRFREGDAIDRADRLQAGGEMNRLADDVVVLLVNLREVHPKAVLQPMSRSILQLEHCGFNEGQCPAGVGEGGEDSITGELDQGAAIETNLLLEPA